MDELRRGINLRAYGQKDPVQEYRLEGFDMFDEMVASIREDTVKLVLTVKLQNDGSLERKQVAKETGTSLGGDHSVKKSPVKKVKVGRNDPCPCGSGKKYKKCCGMEE
jgi:preprotein translocase subunit SecA